MFDAKIPFTIIDNSAFMEVGLGKLFDWSQPAPITLETTNIAVWGDGEAVILTNALSDIARYVVRIIDDPNTLNKRVMIDGHSITQNQVIALWEEITGKKLERKRIDVEELEDMIKKAEGFKKFPLQVWTMALARVFTLHAQNLTAFLACSLWIFQKRHD
jgi:uncharacterized protein YbjT (DUF2867 family)